MELLGLVPAELRSLLAWTRSYPFHILSHHLSRGSPHIRCLYSLGTKMQRHLGASRCRTQKVSSPLSAAPSWGSTLPSGREDSHQGATVRAKLGTVNIEPIRLTAVCESHTVTAWEEDAAPRRPVRAALSSRVHECLTWGEGLQ